MEVKGRPATCWLGLPSDLLIGESTIELLPDRIIEKRKVFFEERETVLFLSEIEGVEITQKGDKIFSFLFLAFLMARIFSLSLISLFIYLLWRPNFLIIHGKSLQIALSIPSKNLEPYKKFIEELIKSKQK
ncbi:MAG: hypothetical protein CBR30_04650 [Dictyoglomus sp. NZ13-RE01]|nr:MAG: hypothetical protein CBR30_04650 [Dictyoglomus sp. NZ13-RE01]